MGRKPMGLAGKTLERAIAAHKSGNATVAESLFEAVLRSKPDNIDALYLLGTLRAEAGQLASAEALLARAARLHPGSAFVQNNLGNVFLLQGKLKPASLAFERALALQPDLIEAEINLGLVLGRLGRSARYPLKAMLRGYERKASSWDADVARPGREFLGPQHVRDFVARACAGRRDLMVADLGCGTGLCGTSLRPLARRLVDVDLSQPMLDQAAAKGC